MIRATSDLITGASRPGTTQAGTGKVLLTLTHGAIARGLVRVPACGLGATIVDVLRGGAVELGTPLSGRI